MSGADRIDTQERLHLSHPEVQHSLNHTHAPAAYVVWSPHAVARGCFVPEFAGQSHLVLPHYMTQRGI